MKEYKLVLRRYTDYDGGNKVESFDVYFDGNYLGKRYSNKIYKTLEEALLSFRQFLEFLPENCNHDNLNFKFKSFGGKCSVCDLVNTKL
jgi:hypothetical protein